MPVEMISNRDLLVVTNLFPSKEKPYYGTFVKNSSDELAKQGWLVSICALPNYGKGLFAYLIFYVAAFFMTLKARGLVYVHYVSHSALPVVIAGLINKKVRIVLHYHGSDAFPEESEGFVRILIKRAVCKFSNINSNFIVVPSEIFKVNFANEYSVPSDMVGVSPSGGVDENLFYVNADWLKKYNVAFVGRFIRGKGALFSARVIDELICCDSSIKALFVGDGEERDEILALVGKYKTSVDLFGLLSQRELADLFRSTDVILFPSDRKGESLGLVWVEAVFCGAVPIIKNNGLTEYLVPEYIRDHITANDECEFVKKAQFLLNNKKFRYEVWFALSCFLQEKYSKRVVSENLNSLLYAVIAK